MTERYKDSTDNRKSAGHTRIMTDEDRQNFDGLTIDESGDEVHTESTPYTEHEESGGRYYYNRGPQSRIKIINLTGGNWVTRIFWLVLLGVILACIVFFGGIILSVIGVIVLIGAVISFLLGLF